MRVQRTMNYDMFHDVLVGEVFESDGEYWLKTETGLLSQTYNINAVRLDGKSYGAFAEDSEVVRHNNPVVVLEGDSLQ